MNVDQDVANNSGEVVELDKKEKRGKSSRGRKPKQTQKTAEKNGAELPEPSGEENGQNINLKLSSSLASKLKRQAQEEGISLEEFVTELLAEGAVLRAWEIVERKAQMRGGNSQPNNNNNNQGGRPGRGNRQQNSKGRRNSMSHQRYTSIMDDKASFLEYVRNQEKKQGR